MSLSVQQTTIRLGLSLQAAVEYSISTHLTNKFTYTASYDDGSIVPDFVFMMPNGATHVMEVTNTDARDSLRMKVLRYLELVSEVKITYGAKCVCTSLMFGNAAADLPANNIRAMAAFFDSYSCVQNVVSPVLAKNVRSLEESLRTLAANSRVKTVEQAARKVCESHPHATKAIADVVSQLLRVRPNAKWALVWKEEAKRHSTSSSIIPIIDGVGIKRAILDSLLLGQISPAQLRSGAMPKDRIQLFESLGLIVQVKSIKGIAIKLRSDLQQLYGNRELLALRHATIQRLSSSSTSKSIVDDILDEKRRKRMCEIYLAAARTKALLTKAIIQTHSQDDFQGIQHGRCWIADLVPLAQDSSHNRYNSLVVAHKDYSSSLANPYPNIVIKSGFAGRRIADLAGIISDIYFDNGGTPSDLLWEQLSARLLQFRRGSLIKLHSVNPLRILIDEWAHANSVELAYASPDNIVSSFLDDDTGTAEYKVTVARRGDQCIYINAIYVDTYGGLDKAKEWSARGRALQFRFNGTDVAKTQIDGMLFVADGHWKPKALARLSAGGWCITTPSQFSAAANAMLCSH